MMMYLLFALAFGTTFFMTPMVISAVKDKFEGRDLHKAFSPVVAELGGIAIGAGIIASLIFLIAIMNYTSLRQWIGIEQLDIDIPVLLAVLAVISLAVIIGLVDDILGVRQVLKFLSVFIIALPLMAVKVSHPLAIPLLNIVIANPVLYELILIPLGICAVTNLTNTFAGFNGLEAGMGAIIALALLILGVHLGSVYISALSIILLGALLAFLVFNWYPSKIFPDDVGTLVIGSMIAVIVIVGRIEFAGLILLLPYIIDFIFFKIPNRLPSNGWHGQYDYLDKRLYCDGKPVHLAQWLMKKANGIGERNLVLIFMSAEAVLGLIAIGLYW